MSSSWWTILYDTPWTKQNMNSSCHPLRLYKKILFIVLPWSLFPKCIVVGHCRFITAFMGHCSIVITTWAMSSKRSLLLHVQDFSVLMFILVLLCPVVYISYVAVKPLVPTAAVTLDFTPDTCLMYKFVYLNQVLLILWYCPVRPDWTLEFCVLKIL